jgi:ribosomal protein L40E
MRTLVEPPPALRCEVCNGELRLKKTEQDTSEFDITTFVCTKCGHKESYRARHDPRSAPRASEKPAADVE